jgi:GMP synthase-like glutamine amidotransferase
MELRVAILRADDVRPELAGTFGEYPEMFEVLLSDANIGRALTDQVLLRTEAFRANQGVYPANIDDYDAFIITGSKSGVYEDLPWITVLGDFVKLLYQRKKKLIGICFGHQLIASVLGGEAGKASTGWKIGVKVASLNGDFVNKFSGTERFKLLYSHQDQVFKVATGARILASTPGCPIAMTSLDEHVLTLQGHPEFSSAYAGALYQLRKDAYPQDCFKEAVESLGEDTDHLAVARWMIDFMVS